MSSSLTQVTVVPAGTVSVSGSKVKFAIFTVIVAAMASVTASAITATTVAASSEILPSMSHRLHLRTSSAGERRIDDRERPRRCAR